MIRKEQFEWAVDTLVKAFFEGTLISGNCATCAIGNLICAKYGIDPLDEDACHKHNLMAWWYWDMRNDDVAERQFELIGYNRVESMRIERAFEGNTILDRDDYSHFEDSDIIEDQFNGLMAVLDVLFEIHQVGEDERPAYQAKFERHPELV